MEIKETEYKSLNTEGYISEKGRIKELEVALLLACKVIDKCAICNDGCLPPHQLVRQFLNLAKRRIENESKKEKQEETR